MPHLRLVRKPGALPGSIRRLTVLAARNPDAYSARVSEPLRLRVIVSRDHDPWRNLAFEDWVFRTVDEDELVFYVWRNGPTVVIGRHQNPWVECRLDDMARDGIKLARRSSGGGAVFHDLGNTNFTFATRRRHYSVERQIGTITAALSRLGMEAAFSGRNDIVVDGRKVSGSAFFGRGDRWLHHGTLLIDADLGRLSHYLTVAPAKIAAKGVKSVRARVANLVDFVPDLGHEAVVEALLDAFRAEYGRGFELVTADPESIDDAELAELVRHYGDETWRYGRTPQFSHELSKRFVWGGLDLHVDVKRGVVDDVEIFSDALSLELIDALRESLLGSKYRRDDAATRLVARTPDDAPWAAAATDVAEWLRGVLPPS